MMQAMQMVNKLISTHALTEGDEETLKAAAVATISTHALTEGDNQSNHNIPKTEISTHALTEGDVKGLTAIVKEGDFNSRPHGGRLGMTEDDYNLVTFQLTPSRRATFPLNRWCFCK